MAQGFELTVGFVLMEKEMEPTVVYWGYLGITETTTMGFIGFRV